MYIAVIYISVFHVKYHVKYFKLVPNKYLYIQFDLKTP